MTMRRHRDRGTALLELAIVAPLLIVMVFGVIDLGRLIYTRITLHEAVQEGSIYASTNPDDPNGTIFRVVESVDNPAIDPANVTVECPSDTIRIATTHDMALVTPLFRGRTVTLTAEVTTDIFSSDDCVPDP